MLMEDDHQFRYHLRIQLGKAGKNKALGGTNTLAYLPGV
jgi:hypothetical protein